MSLSKIQLCNAASIMIGAGVIQSLDDDTDLARIFANLYEVTKIALLSRYPWNFLKEDAYLTRLSGDPVRGFKYGYLIPGDALAGAPHAVFSYQGQKLGTSQYRVAGNKVYADFPELWGTFIMNRVENEWPGYFHKLMVHALAADVALPVTDQQSIADRHYALAYGTPSEGGIGGLMGEAMLLDSQSDGTKGVDAGTFIAARHGGGW